MHAAVNSLLWVTFLFLQPTYTKLGLRNNFDKKGIMWKTGPQPSWYSPWRRRLFVLKGNFLYYFDSTDSHDDPPVLGAIFLKDAIIEKDAMPLAKFVLKISPVVKRRPNWEGDEEGSVFHLKFQTEENRSEVCGCVCTQCSSWSYTVQYPINRAWWVVGVLSTVL